MRTPSTPCVAAALFTLTSIFALGACEGEGDGNGVPDEVAHLLQCETDADCPNLGLPCISLSCGEAGACTPTTAADDSDCDDGDECTLQDHCAAARCVAGGVLACDDGNDCTVDACVTGLGCTTISVLSGLACADGNACTEDICDAETGCRNEAKPGPCSDGSDCTTGEACDAGVCKGGTPISCDDGNGCTLDVCLPGQGCVGLAALNDAGCDDGDACTGPGMCEGSACVTEAIDVVTACDDDNLCTDDGCAADTGCTHAANALVCDDDNACTETDACAAGVCAGLAIDVTATCGDGNVCTSDGCEAAAGCVNPTVADGTPCSDGIACTTSDACKSGQCAGLATLYEKSAQVAEYLEGEFQQQCYQMNVFPGDPQAAGDIGPNDLVAADGAFVAVGGQKQLLFFTGASGPTASVVLSSGLAGESARAVVKVGDQLRVATNTMTPDHGYCTTQAGLLATNASGQPLWSKLYVANDVYDGSEALDLVGLQAGVAMLGVSLDQGAQRETWLLRADGAGTKTWVQPLALADAFRGEALAATANGDLVAVGRSHAQQGPRPAMVTKNSGLGQPVWQSKIGTISSRLSAVVALPQGGLAAAGQINNAAWLLRLTGAGEVLWQRQYGQGEWRRFADLAVTADAGFLLTGRSWSAQPGAASTVLRLDSSGNQVWENVPMGGSWYARAIVAQPGGGGAVLVRVGGAAKLIRFDAFGNSSCAGAGACWNKPLSDCLDSNPCTSDGCDAVSSCQHANLGTACDDGSLCTELGVCNSGSCTNGAPVSCDDSNVCTTDSCAPNSGCQHANTNGNCDDGNICTSGDACADGACGGLTVPDAIVCSDNDACTSDDHCATGACVGLPLPQTACDDDILCTSDVCDPAAGCQHGSNALPCDDSDACTTEEVCFGGQCRTEYLVELQAPPDLGGVFIEAVATNAAGEAFTCRGNRLWRFSATGVIPEDMGYVQGGCQALAVAANGNVYASSMSGAIIRLRYPDNGVWVQFAGNGYASFADGQGANARFKSVTDMAVDAAGNLYAADISNYRIRKITPQGMVSTLAGDGTAGFVDGPAATARFNRARGVDVAADGAVYVADMSNHRIRKIAAGQVTTVAGTGVESYLDGPGNLATFKYPADVLVLADGSLLVADTNNNRLRPISAQGVVSTLLGGTGNAQAGNMQTAKLDRPQRLALGLGGALFIGRLNGNAYKLLPKLTVDCTDNNPCTADSCNAQQGCVHNAAPGACDDGDPCTLQDSCQEGACAGTPKPCTSEPCVTEPVCLSGQCVPDPVQWLVGHKVFGGHSVDAVGRAAVLRSPRSISAHPSGGLALLSGSGAGCALRRVLPSLQVAVDTGLQGTEGNTGCWGSQVVYDTADHAWLVVRDRIWRLPGDGSKVWMAGTGDDGFADGAAAQARFDGPKGLAISGDGRLYIADSDNRRIRVLHNGQVSTLAGDGVPGHINGTGAAARFDFPTEMVLDAQGNLLVADRHAIRKVTPAGVVTTVAGAMVHGYQDGAGDVARFRNIEGLTLLVDGHLLVADAGNERLRKVSPQGVVSTFGGKAPCEPVCTPNIHGDWSCTVCIEPNEGSLAAVSGIKATFPAMMGLAALPNGDIWVLDRGVLLRIRPTGPKDCDDNNVCTTDSCNPQSGCAHVAANGPCDDGSLCTSADACANGVCAGQAVNCDDNDPCTQGSCQPQTGCAQTPKDGPCGGDGACFTSGTCVAGVCQGQPKNCSDNKACTLDSCANGVCLHINHAADCDDGSVCTIKDVCANGVCTGQNINCNDKNPCTTDTCESKNGCVNAANTAPCGEGCKIGTCSQGQCQIADKACDDNKPCTLDGCKDGQCTHANTVGPCEDGTVCTTGDKCSDGQCLGAALKCNDGNPCTKDECDAETGCKQSPATAPCDDGDKCTINDACTDGVCTGGNKCDDGNACTTDLCSQGGDKCASAAKVGICSLGDLGCAASGICASGACFMTGTAAFETRLPGKNVDISREVIPSGLGWATIGHTTSAGAGGMDAWLVVLNSKGKVAWQKTYGGQGTDIGRSIARRTGGGFAVVGRTDQAGDAAGDAWLMLLDPYGKVDKQTFYGSKGHEEFWSVVPVGKLWVAAGQSNTSGLGKTDGLLVRFGADGDQHWDKSFGGAEDDVLKRVVTRSDGSLQTIGWTKSSGAGDYDIWYMHLMSEGYDISQATFGGAGPDLGFGIAPLSDGALLAGRTRGSKDDDGWLARIKTDGSLLWQRKWAAGGNSALADVVERSDGSIGFCGYRAAKSGDPAAFWFGATNALGVPVWQRSRPTGGSGECDSLRALTAGGLVLVGYEPPSGGGGAGSPDGTVIRVDAFGHATCSASGDCWSKLTSECDDSNDCTADLCTKDKGCEHNNFADGAACGDGSKTCNKGACE